MKNGKTDLDFLREAYEFANQYSLDRSVKNAALLVNNGEVIVRAANCFPRKVNITDERLAKRPDKYYFTEHAERAAIFLAIKDGITDFKDLVMYCPWHSCHDCARAIIGVGIKEVVGHQSTLDIDESIARKDGRINWKESIEAAWKMYNEVGVKYRYVVGKVGGVKNLHAGQIWEP